MSDNANSENIENQHSALSKLWPSDLEESKKLAEEKQQKRENLVALGDKFKQAREALGYNISDLNEHTGLSFTELEALEHGQFQHIEQQDYVDYYVHTYASLLGLDADDFLEEFKQNFYDADDAQDAETIDFHDESQYEDAFAEEARKTLEALDASDVNALQAANRLEIENSAEMHATQPSDERAIEYAEATLGHTEPQFENTTQTEMPNELHLQADLSGEPFTSASQTNSLPWLKLGASFAVILLAAVGIYFVNAQFSASPESEQVANLNEATTNITKDTDRIPETQKANKIGQLESKVLKQGSDDLSAPTAEMVQKPLVLIGQETNDGKTEAPTLTLPKNTEITDIISETIDTGTDAIKNAAVKASDSITQVIDTNNNDDLAKASELAKAAQATKDAIENATKQAAEQAAKALPEPKTAELPENPIQEALSQLPSDVNKYSLHATKNSWVLIEDSAAQILFSDELTPEKIITLPKTKGVIISLANAGAIEVYKGKKLVGKLGAEDETLDLVLIEQRLNQITN
ncbi:MAG: helix-turn-helix domain-containing protein [Hyphomicrobiales bacterium]